MVEISCDRARLDVPMIHDFLTKESTWAAGIALHLVQRALDNSLCFGAYESGSQIGFARVVTDYATFGYLCDVLVPIEYRGRGISRLLMDAVVAHPDLQSLRRFILVTSTAAPLYEKYGWKSLHAPTAHMERYDPDVYKRQGS